MHLLEIVEQTGVSDQFVLETKSGKEIHEFTILIKLILKKLISLHFSPRQVIVLFNELFRNIFR